MTRTDNPVPGTPGDLPDPLRWELRALRRDVEPAHDLWPGIAARLQATTPARRGLRAARWRVAVPLATAAALALAVGLGWQQRNAPAADSQQAQLLAAEADAMTREYQAALLELDRGAPPATQVSDLRVLDRSAAQIRTALQRDPDARFLLDRLQDTYARRLELTQRLAQPTLST